MVEIKSRKATRRLLGNFSAEDLVNGFRWLSTPQGVSYWITLYNDLYHDRPVSTERIEEAKGHIRKMLGIVDLETEAEWE